MLTFQDDLFNESLPRLVVEIQKNGQSPKTLCILFYAMLLNLNQYEKVPHHIFNTARLAFRKPLQEIDAALFTIEEKLARVNTSEDNTND